MAPSRVNAASPSKRRFRNCAHCGVRLHPSNWSRHTHGQEANARFTANVKVPTHYPPVRRSSSINLEGIDVYNLSSFHTSDLANLPDLTSSPTNQPNDPNGLQDVDEDMDEDGSEANGPATASPSDQPPNPPPSDTGPPHQDQMELEQHSPSSPHGSAVGSGETNSTTSSHLASPVNDGSPSSLLPLVNTASERSDETPSQHESAPSDWNTHSSVWSDQRDVYEPLDGHAAFIAGLPQAPPDQMIDGGHLLEVARFRKYLLAFTSDAVRANQTSLQVFRRVFRTTLRSSMPSKCSSFK